MAKDIFSKYSSGAKAKDNDYGGRKKLPATSYIRNKKKQERTTAKSAAAAAESSSPASTPRKPPARKYAPRLTTERPGRVSDGKGGQFWPTPRPFSPKRKMTSRFDDHLVLMEMKTAK